MGMGMGMGMEAKPAMVRVTSEFDSESSAFFHRASCKLLQGVAKLKLSFNNCDLSEVALVTKHLSLHHDPQDRNTLLKASLDLPHRLQLRASHELNSRRGDLSLLATLPDPNYSILLSSSLPPDAAPPNATFKFPLGELTLDREEDAKRPLSVQGVVKASLLSGLCSAHYADDGCKLRYAFKDDQMSFIPSISLPSSAVSCTFKRRFGPSHKLSYLYNFDVNNWSAVYKLTYGKDLKLKAGYDSEVRVGWASLWVGEENGKAKAAPLKMKIQFMLQVPQDDVKSSALMFRVKKRWDI